MVAPEATFLWVSFRKPSPFLVSNVLFVCALAKEYVLHPNMQTSGKCVFLVIPTYLKQERHSAPGSPSTLLQQAAARSAAFAATVTNARQSHPAQPEGSQAGEAGEE